MLFLGNAAGIVVFTLMLLRATALAPMPDQAHAVDVAQAIDAGALWQVSTVLYLLGLLSGFLLLGVALWRAGFGRVASTAVGLGLVLHIAGGDWLPTSVAGALTVCGGLVAVAVTIAWTMPTTTDGAPHAARAQRLGTGVTR